MNDIYFPDTDSFDAGSMWQWYQNMIKEMPEQFLTATEIEHIEEYYSEAGLMQWWRRPFFRRHYAESFTDAARYLLDSPSEGVIVDLGCGIGTQSLFLALGGAKVVGVDMDSVALEIFRKRKAWYEEKLGRTLDIEFLEGSVFDIDLGRFGPIRGVFSMFAFNMMQPSGKLLDQLKTQMDQGSRIVIIDGNINSLVCKLLRSRRREVWSPGEFRNELEARSVNVSSQLGGVVFPPLLWRFFPFSLIAGMDRRLCRNMLLPISHQVMGEMSQDARQ